MYFSDNLGRMGDFKQTTIQENVNLTLLGKIYSSVSRINSLGTISPSDGGILFFKWP